MAKKSTQIKLYNKEGKLETHKSGKIMARATRDIMKMYAEMEREGQMSTDAEFNPVNEYESMEKMLDLVANSIFANNDEVTEDTILDGLESDKLIETLNQCIMEAMGIDEEEVEKAQEGK